MMEHIMERFSRRHLLAATVSSATAAGLGWGWYRQRQRVIRIGLIGCGMRGMQLAGLINGTHWYDVSGQIVAISDVHRTRAEQTRAKHAPGADVYSDFRQILNRGDIDAVFIATPDHWHAPCALEALRAGKHVYCEKPMTLTIAEGQALVTAVHDTGRTFLVGTQQRSFRQFQQACELVRNGRLGNLKRVDITVPVNQSGGPFASRPVPEGLDWQRWLGPALSAEYSDERYAGFRYFYDYSGGTMTDWGAHNVDIVHWAMNLEDSGPIEISSQADMPAVEDGYMTPVEFEVEMKYANGVTARVRPSSTEHGILFEGDEGRIYVGRKRFAGEPVEDLAKNPLPRDGVTLTHPRTNLFSGYNTSHLLHFFDCILTNQKPISDVISQHRSVSACHLANISMRLGRSLKWDPEKEEVIGDAQATSMLSRLSRSV